MSRRWMIGGGVFLVLGAISLLIAGINMRYRHTLSNRTFVTVGAVLPLKAERPPRPSVREDDWPVWPDPTAALEAVVGLLLSAAAGYSAAELIRGEEDGPGWGEVMGAASGEVIGAGLILLALLAVAALAWSQSPPEPPLFSTSPTRIESPRPPAHRPAQESSPAEQAVFAAIVGALGALACYVVLDLGGPRGQSEEAAEAGVPCAEPETLPMPDGGSCPGRDPRPQQAEE